MLITHTDGTVHFSDLKQLAKSAAHYKYRCAHPIEPTRDMRIGSYVNQLVLGKAPRREIVVFDGDTRRGKVWDDFLIRNGGREILTRPEAMEAEPIADAVLTDLCAQELLGLYPDIDSVIRRRAEVRYEVPLSWTDNDIPCSTTGIDIVSPSYLADLKVVHNAEPEYLQKHALRMMWHAQLVWYLGGWLNDPADAPPVDSTKALHLLCVESSPPHCVTVLTLSAEVIDAGEKCIRAWMERLKVCAESDAYPGYVQSPVQWELPEWMTGEVDDEETPVGG